MKVTRKDLEEKLKDFNRMYGTDGKVVRRNGHFGVDRNNCSITICVGSLRECYDYIYTMMEGVYLLDQIKREQLNK